MNPTKSVQFFIAEVISYNDTYKNPDSDRDDSINSINVLVKEGDTPFLIKNVCPFNSNLKQIPIIGENVLICQGYSSFSSYDDRVPKWYYLQPMSVQSSVNNNIIKNNRGDAAGYEDDTVFAKTKVNSLQPYRGDLLIEGRWGNTIRLGSTVKSTSEYSTAPLWKGSKDTDPIIILSNNVSTSNNVFHVENTEKDHSSLYITSTQQISTLKLGDQNKRNPLKKYANESTFKKSQLIGIADRIILKSKTDIVALDSPKAIILNTTGEFRLGSDQADIPLVHGDVLYKILMDIIKQLKLAPIQCGSAVGTFLTTSFVDDAQKKLKELLSKKYFITKTK